MRKRMYILWIALLLAVLLALTACSRKTEDETDDAETAPADEPDDTPTYRIDFGGKNAVFVGVKERYAAGEEVILNTDLVMDASPVVTSD